MKAMKLLAMLLLLTAGLVACDKDDDEKKPEEEQKVEVIHEMDGYIYVTTKYFTNKFYGNDAKLKVSRSNGIHIVEFSDPQWGNALFPDVKLGEVLAGTGTLTMVYQGKEGTYDATISGPMTAPVISLPDVMGGTEIHFFLGTATDEQQ